MISFLNVDKKYKDNTMALINISTQINDGEFVFLTGQSGAGKSTFIKLLLKEIDSSDGKIIVNDYTLNDIKHNEIPYYRRKIGVVFQDYKLLTKKNVYENIAFALMVIDTPEEEIPDKVMNVLRIVNLADKKNNYPNELSGGEQQRIAIARAIVNNPTIIIADEPTGNLDPETAKDIMDLFIDINKKYNTTIIMATHNKEIVDKYCKRVIQLEKGRIIRDEKHAMFYGGVKN